MVKDIRCPSCSKLLAVYNSEIGRFETKLGHKITISLLLAEITCEKCKTVTRLDSSRNPYNVVSDIRPQNVPFRS